MTKILLSINPEYVQRIFDGTKKFEFRRVRCKEKIDRLVIYCTSPIKQVVGEVEVEAVLSETPSDLWKQTENWAGVEKDFFDSYFEGKEDAHAYKLGKVIKYDNPKRLIDFGINTAPQSFVYLK